ncbi:probable sodium/metabolite cotransporter BASS1, chloroplastic [Salvia hispanica]|uniref:probable sodium/metabolite cotransporter BASS1, chloroplastic n=1 Tax=Salvia hispanica TaxID=49212 RepID=UPI002008FFD7|nr:probable sodium/metabolite cotransporter BASS1, chloroplastic [Salvia hispanica]
MELTTAKSHSPIYALLRRPPPPRSPKSHISPISIKLHNPQSQSQFQIPKPLFAARRPELKPTHCGNSSNAVTAEERSWIEAAGEAVSTAFPVWVALGCLLGLLRPSSFNWMQPKLTVMGITLTMLGMGMTLTFDDLRGALAMPKELFAGFFLQYSIMPLSGYFVSKLLNLPSYYAAGLILVGCCPGGTASNIVTYIARGNVALSVLMTAASTLSAVVSSDSNFICTFEGISLRMFTFFQNSVLGVVLAKHFGNPLTAVPCAVSSVCHSIFGSALAGIWRRDIPQKDQDEKQDA